MNRAQSWMGVNVRLEEQQRQHANLIESLQWTGAGGDTQLIEQLSGYDPGTVDLLVSMAAWEMLGTTGANSDKERELALKRSRIIWKYNPIGALAIDTWTAWGMGEQVSVTLDDESAQPVWDEFWEADRNALLLAPHKIHKLSDWLLVTGNRFFVFFASTVDGKSTVRLLDQDELEIIVNPADKLVPWFYKRTFALPNGGEKSLYYPDWRIKFGVEGFEDIERAWQVVTKEKIITGAPERADRVQSSDVQFGREKVGTDVCVMHSAHWEKDEASLWGWPLTTVAANWLVAHKGLAEAHYSVARSKAQFARKFQVSGSSRATQSVIDAIKSNLDRNTYLDSNPPAAAGSSLVHNRAIDHTELPMTTGAQDFEKDESAYARIAGMGMHMTPVLMGYDLTKYATSVAMDKASSILFQRYSAFWSAQFQNMAKIVLGFLEVHGSELHEDKGSSTSIDSLTLVDVPDMVDPIARFMNELTNSVNAGILPGSAVAAIDAEVIRPVLQAIGSSKAADLTSDEAFEIGDFEPEPEPEPEPPPMIPMQPAQQLPEEMPESLQIVAANYAEGAINLEALAECVLAEWVERQRSD